MHGAGEALLVNFKPRINQTACLAEHALNMMGADGRWTAGVKGHPRRASCKGSSSPAAPKYAASRACKLLRSGVNSRCDNCKSGEGDGL